MRIIAVRLVWRDYLGHVIFDSDSFINTNTSVRAWKSDKYHLDIWTGSSQVNGGKKLVHCQNILGPSPNLNSIVKWPPKNLPVDCKYFFRNRHTLLRVLANTKQFQGYSNIHLKTNHTKQQRTCSATASVASKTPTQTPKPHAR